MTTTELPPPAYTGDKAPPPTYSGDQAPPPSHAAQPPAKLQGHVIYWTFWGVLFGTLLTWVFAVSAAADDAWFSYSGYTGLGFESDICAYTGNNDEFDEICDLFEAGKAFQFMATILVSIVLVVVVVAAFMRAPVTGKLGLAAGIMLAVFAVFQLIAFACMAAMVSKYNNYFGTDVTAGPTLGVAVVAWLLGTAGAIATLVLLRRATTDQDGPFTKCMPRAAGGTNAGAPPAAGATPAVGTV